MRLGENKQDTASHLVRMRNSLMTIIFGTYYFELRQSVREMAIRLEFERPNEIR